MRTVIIVGILCTAMGAGLTLGLHYGGVLRGAAGGTASAATTSPSHGSSARPAVQPKSSDPPPVRRRRRVHHSAKTPPPKPKKRTPRAELGSRAPYRVLPSRPVWYRRRPRHSFGKARFALLISIDGLSYDVMRRERARMPNLRKLLRRGFLRPMHTVFPAMTWPSHVSLATGQYPRHHGVLGNRWLEQKPRWKYVHPYRKLDVDKRRRKRTPSLFDIVNKAGGITASINWPATQGAKTLTYNLPEFMHGGELTYRFLSSPMQKLIEALYLKDDVTGEGRWTEDEIKKGFGKVMAEDEDHDTDTITAELAATLIVHGKIVESARQRRVRLEAVKQRKAAHARGASKKPQVKVRVVKAAGLGSGSGTGTGAGAGTGTGTGTATGPGSGSGTGSGVTVKVAGTVLTGFAARLAAVDLKVPKLLMAHFVAYDTFAHRWGPNSKEALEALEKIDEKIGAIIVAYKKRDLLDDTVVFVTADHGFAEITHGVNLYKIYEEHGLDEPSEGNKKAPIVTLINSQVAYLYLRKGEGERLETLVNALRKPEYKRCIFGAYVPEEYQKLGLPIPPPRTDIKPDKPEDNAKDASKKGDKGSKKKAAHKKKRKRARKRRAAAPLRHLGAPDLVVVTMPDCRLRGGTKKVISKWPKPRRDAHIGSHGFIPHTRPMRAFLIGAGPGIRQRRRVGSTCRAVDVAPTIAHLLGVRYPRRWRRKRLRLDGRVLSSAIVHDKPRRRSRRRSRRRRRRR
ncbi:MAG: alkaline phosphatase family protein [Myxococcales bacterium]|nr:alkaline phosphatase family protein [Myxococcales bacterium]